MVFVFLRQSLSFVSIENHLVLYHFTSPYLGNYNINMDLALYFQEYLGTSQFASLRKVAEAIIDIVYY